MNKKYIMIANKKKFELLAFNLFAAVLLKIYLHKYKTYAVKYALKRR
jgi:hypothetical protein